MIVKSGYLADYKLFVKICKALAARHGGTAVE